MDLLKNFVLLSENFGIVSAFDLFSLEDQSDFEILSPNELEIYSKFTSAKRKRGFVAGRAACKKAFFKLTEGKTDCFEKFPFVSVLNSETGAPFIENSDLFVSISHSHEAAIASVCQHTVGVDIERIDPKRIPALKRMSAEYPEKDAQELTVLWTLKESLGKALRTGVVEEFSHYEIKNFRSKDGIYYCEFKNFPFSGVSIANDKYAISLVSSTTQDLSKNPTYTATQSWNTSSNFIATPSCFSA